MSYIPALDKLGIKYTIHNNGHHIRMPDYLTDFWPSTGKWISTVVSGKGLQSLLEFLSPVVEEEDDSYMQSLINDYENRP